MEATSFIFESNLDPVPSLPFEKEDVDLVVFFGLRELLQEELISTLRDGFPNAQLIGCSSAGEIYDGHYRQNTVVVMAISFARSRCHSCYFPSVPFEDQGTLGQSIANKLAAPDLKGILFFAEGLESDVDPIIANLRTRLRERNLAPVIFGGKAGDNLRFDGTIVVHNGAIHTEGVVATGLYGDSLEVRGSTSNVWPCFDQVFEITAGDANLIMEFDGKPAVEGYAELLGGSPVEEVLKNSGYHPLILQDEDGQPTYARTVFGHDPATGALLCAGNVEGKVRIANLTQESFIDGIREVIKNAAEIQPDLMLLASCVGRRLTLGSEVETEGDTIRKYCSDIPLVGGYCYGEVGYCPHLGQSEFLNHSFTGLALREI